MPYSMDGSDTHSDEDEWPSSTSSGDSIDDDTSSYDENDSQANDSVSDLSRSSSDFTDSDDNTQARQQRFRSSNAPRNFGNGFVTSLRRRVVGRDHYFDSESDDDYDNDDVFDDDGAPQDSPAANNSRRKKKRYSSSPFWFRFVNCLQVYHDRCPLICNRFSTLCLFVSFAIWIMIHILYPKSHPPKPLMTPRDKMYSLTVQERIRLRRTSINEKNLTPDQLREQRSIEAQKKLGTGAQRPSSSSSFFQMASDGLWSLVGSSKNNNMEAIPPDCVLSEWQTMSYPNCNDLHEIDLKDLYNSAHRAGKSPPNLVDAAYISSGLWRDVWSLIPRWDPYTKDSIAVLKMMKSEHEFDARNFDRHRRDALVMEQLTASPHVVSIYGHCGNTVLTEYAYTSLDKVLSNAVPAPNPLMSRRTPRGRLQLALQVAKGVSALHEMKEGPVIHADLQSKQFVVDKKGTVKLNDFNRCRFMPRKISTREKCNVYIPTAPGSSRAPEEYEFKALDEKLDVYSLANVMYTILTGEKPWKDAGSTNVKKSIKRGKKPPIDTHYRTPDSTDASLAILIELAYEYDPTNRPSADGLVREIELLLKDQESDRKVGLRTTTRK